MLKYSKGIINYIKTSLYEEVLGNSILGNSKIHSFTLFRGKRKNIKM